MERLIALLDQKTKEIPERCFLNLPATEDEIREFELHMGLKLNESIRRFYLYCDGGFIATDQWDASTLKDEDMLPTVKWNSNYFLSLYEIYESYHGSGKYMMLHLADVEEEHGPKLIPLIQTDGQEMLVLDASDPEKSGPVLDAFHEEPWRQWGSVYKSFEDLLEEYIRREGRIKTIG